MSGFFQDLLKGAVGGFFGSDYLRDYTHASKTFTPNFYQNTPKFKFLFHTYFNINQQIYDAGFDNRQNLGLLVKDVKLPSYTFETSQLNQYNRKRVIQTKIKYDPITITFHDDNANQATKLWEAYFKYNYRDADRRNSSLVNNLIDLSSKRNIYEDNVPGSTWGYSGDTFFNNNEALVNRKLPFFNNITIYGLNRHNFTSYTLVNPIITQFNHDTYDYSQGNGIMQNQMTIDYETVIYDYGSIDGTNPGKYVQGFGNEENYDRRLSPISIPGSNKTILGQGGLLDAAGGTIESLQQGDILGAALQAGKAYNTFKGSNLKSIAKQELLNGVTTALTNPETTRNIIALIPKISSSPSPASPSSNLGVPISVSDTSRIV
jgi:hypothetical protein